MTRLRFAPSAERDLRDIAEFTADRFGPRQAKAYAARLRAKINKAMGNRALLRPRPELGDGVFAVFAESHVVFGRF